MDKHRVITISAKDGVNIDESAISEAEALGVFEAQQCFTDTLAVYAFDQHGMFVRGWSAEAETLAAALGQMLTTNRSFSNNSGPEKGFMIGWTDPEAGLGIYDKAKEVFHEARSRGYAGGLWRPTKPPVSMLDPEPEVEDAKPAAAVRLASDMSPKACIKRLTEWLRTGQARPEGDTNGRHQFDADMEVVSKFVEKHVVEWHTTPEERAAKGLDVGVAPDKPFFGLDIDALMNRLNEEIETINFDDIFTVTPKFSVEDVERGWDNTDRYRKTGLRPYQFKAADWLRQAMSGGKRFELAPGFSATVLKAPVDEQEAYVETETIAARQLGRYARLLGFGRDTNPHSPSCSYHAEWNTGWDGPPDAKAKLYRHPNHPLPVQIKGPVQRGSQIVPPITAYLTNKGEVVKEWTLDTYGADYGVELAGHAKQSVFYDGLTLDFPGDWGSFTAELGEHELKPGYTHVLGTLLFTEVE